MKKSLIKLSVTMIALSVVAACAPQTRYGNQVQKRDALNQTGAPTVPGLNLQQKNEAIRQDETDKIVDVNSVDLKINKDGEATLGLRVKGKVVSLSGKLDEKGLGELTSKDNKDISATLTEVKDDTKSVKVTLKDGDKTRELNLEIASAQEELSALKSVTFEGGGEKGVEKTQLENLVKSLQEKNSLSLKMANIKENGITKIVEMNLGLNEKDKSIAALKGRMLGMSAQSVLLNTENVIQIGDMKIINAAITIARDEKGLEKKMLLTLTVQNKDGKLGKVSIETNWMIGLSETSEAKADMKTTKAGQKMDGKNIEMNR